MGLTCEPGEAARMLCPLTQPSVRLVNNAGVYDPAAGVQAATATDIDWHMKVNVYGAIQLTLEVLPLLRKGQGKKIFTTSSLMGSVTVAPTLPWAPACT